MAISTYESTHVLMAEDDDDDYMFFSLAVNELSVKVVLTRAENGDILFKLLEKDEEHPDMLFLDLLLPCKNGKDCLREIRANRKYDSMPIIVYSSLEDLQSIEFCYREGSNLYAIKPHSLVELKDVLEKIFSVNWKKMMYYPPKSSFVINA
ncbi:response regulator [Filimonas effusa]|uniref:Response regulator n=1 Tax=Filimonas effusa TaxID=2508721 RepID=A0A4Q1DAS1_9BACT|nr:response regulator [Filimonas effusa]RXK86360.1 response regulator [Filimonas effusa]